MMPESTASEATLETDMSANTAASTATTAATVAPTTEVCANVFDVSQCQLRMESDSTLCEQPDWIRVCCLFCAEMTTPSGSFPLRPLAAPQKLSAINYENCQD